MEVREYRKLPLGTYGSELANEAPHRLDTLVGRPVPLIDEVTEHRVLDRHALFGSSARFLGIDTQRQREPLPQTLKAYPSLVMVFKLSRAFSIPLERGLKS